MTTPTKMMAHSYWMPNISLINCPAPTIWAVA